MDIKIRRRTLNKINSILFWGFVWALLLVFFILVAWVAMVFLGILGVVLVIIGAILFLLYFFGFIRLKVIDDRGKGPKNGGHTDK